MTRGSFSFHNKCVDPALNELPFWARQQSMEPKYRHSLTCLLSLKLSAGSLTSRPTEHVPDPRLIPPSLHVGEKPSRAKRDWFATFLTIHPERLRDPLVGLQDELTAVPHLTPTPQRRFLHRVGCRTAGRPATISSRSKEYEDNENRRGRGRSHEPAQKRPVGGQT